MEKASTPVDIIYKYFNDFTPQQMQQWQTLESVYVAWNNQINVISRKDIEGLYEKHVLHSLSIATAFEFAAGTRIIDIGTGGGFPGIPLAIFFPEVQFFLVDSIAKKLKVVQAVVDALALKNVSVQHTRVEDMKNKTFDYAVSRAVAPLKDLIQWAKPLIRKNNHHLKKIPVVPKQALPSKMQFNHTADSSEVYAEQESNGMTNNGLSKMSNMTYPPNGLICLKGGDLSQEIADTGVRPRMVEIHQLFQESFFKEKYLLHVKL